jgi:LuxR family quorum sensing-dependent transcriptional regulator
MGDFLSYIQACDRAANTAALFDVFLDGMRGFGFDRVSFNILTDHKSLSLKKGLAVLNNIEPDVIGEYFQRGYDRDDAVLHRAACSVDPFPWEELYSSALAPRQKRCLDFRTRETRCYHGVTSPLYGPYNQRAAVSLFTTEESETPDYKSGLLGAYCNYFYLTYQRFHEDESRVSASVMLSPMETDVLTWAAVGKSDPEIADLLKISPHTVNTHFRHIFRKIDTNNRVHAVTKALLLGIINP